MFIAAHEWSSPLAAKGDSSDPIHILQATSHSGLAEFYQQLSTSRPNALMQKKSADFLAERIAELSQATTALPELPEDLEAWMHAGAQVATAKYSQYLDERKAGAPRRYFSNRAHALFFLRNVAPTKLVDGAWLYGLLRHWRNPRFGDLVKTYVEELGEGAPDKNHVVIYRQLLARYGLDPVENLDDHFYTQGLVQLSLATHAEDFLPEVIGFNLGYEQLPLHLLITAFELNELGIDPYYFTLHVTVDNTDTGHARRAVQAVLDNLPRIGNAEEFWKRVRTGLRLSEVGVGTHDVIAGFDIEAEVVRIFRHKSAAGHGAHSDYCRVSGRNVNDWLASPEDIPAFLHALKNSGWIRLGAPVEQSRLWSLLQGPRAEMFGVFTSYELQVIHDWIRGEASIDGQAYSEVPAVDGGPRRPSFRVAARLAAARGELSFGAAPDDNVLDSDLQALAGQLAGLDEAGQAVLLVDAMSPAHHWTPAGLQATRLFCERAR